MTARAYTADFNGYHTHPRMLRKRYRRKRALLRLGMVLYFATATAIMYALVLLLARSEAGF